MSTNPFAGMVTAITRQAAPAVASPVGKGEGGIAEAGIQLLEEHGPMTTGELMRALQLAHSRLVWGVLKKATLDRRVLRQDGRWLMNPDYLPPYVNRAIEVLRDLGWSVEPPARRPGQ